MNHLRNLQRRFQAYLTGSSDAIKKDIVSTRNALAEHRLGTYFNAYRIRLIDCLAIDYSGLQKYLGEQVFENLALAYLKAHPSSQPSIRWFGKDLVDYLASTYTHQDREFLSELANFEWTQGLVFDARDETSLYRLDDMAMVPAEAWPEIRINFKPAMRWLDLNWNIGPCWVALDDDQEMPEKQRNEYPVRWLLWRKNRDPFWRSLEIHEAWAIEAALNGANFARLCEGLCEWISEDTVAITAAGLLKQWIGDDLVERIDFQ